MKVPHHNTARAFHRRLFDWWGRHGRDLPWRHTRDAYEILVSEIMLQQTQVDRVTEKWPQFLKQFPSADILARASRGDVLRAWQGLGYNRRALNLQRAAQSIVSDHNGIVPRDWDALRELSGIGDYTASAVRVFAFNACDLATDVNVQRVLGRHLFEGALPDGAVLRKNADRLVPAGRSRDFHNALMDYGATVCTADVDICDGWRCSALKVNKTPKRSEPSYRGVPRRIWRGRVVEMLRGAPGGLEREDIVADLFPSQTKEDDVFLDTVLDMLKKDAMIVEQGSCIQLP